MRRMPRDDRILAILKTLSARATYLIRSIQFPEKNMSGWSGTIRSVIGINLGKGFVISTRISVIFLILRWSNIGASPLPAWLVDDKTSAYTMTRRRKIWRHDGRILIIYVLIQRLILIINLCTFRDPHAATNRKSSLLSYADSSFASSATHWNEGGSLKSDRRLLRALVWGRFSYYQSLHIGTRWSWISTARHPLPGTPIMSSDNLARCCR